ncbi:MAG: hypothetical protein GX946_04600 [Oligosphaeraceae bacterium]|nr:hypothetical protein [Oligosphaeraceae bacterium]
MADPVDISLSIFCGNIVKTPLKSYVENVDKSNVPPAPFDFTVMEEKAGEPPALHIASDAIA